jgi:DNA-binding GntR family transcriptional regulator
VSERADPPHTAAKERALAFVKEQILTGAYPGGELISEGQVAAALGLSRTPVREAFLRLEVEGLMRLFPQRGALVVPVSPDEVRSVMEARLVIEQFSIIKVIDAGRARSEAVVERLNEHLAQQRELVGSGAMRQFLDSDRAFHTTLVQAAGNPILASVYDSLRDRQIRMIGESAMRDPGRLKAIVAEHEMIAAAVRARDTAGSRDILRRHLAGTVLAIGLAWDPGFA